MPLGSTEDPANIESVKSASEKYLIFYSSRNERGQLWCPDCVAVEDLIQNTFGPADAPTALIVYVGQRAEWKTPSNVFRGPPFKVESIPTIIRVDDASPGFVDSNDNGNADDPILESLGSQISGRGNKQRKPCFAPSLKSDVTIISLDLFYRSRV